MVKNNNKMYLSVVNLGLDGDDDDYNLSEKYSDKL